MKDLEKLQYFIFIQYQKYKRKEIIDLLVNLKWKYDYLEDVRKMVEKLVDEYTQSVLEEHLLEEKIRKEGD